MRHFLITFILCHFPVHFCSENTTAVQSTSYLNSTDIVIRAKRQFGGGGCSSCSSCGSCNKCRHPGPCGCQPCDNAAPKPCVNCGLARGMNRCCSCCMPTCNPRCIRRGGCSACNNNADYYDYPTSYGGRNIRPGSTYYENGYNNGYNTGPGGFAGMNANGFPMYG